MICLVSDYRAHLYQNEYKTCSASEGGVGLSAGNGNSFGSKHFSGGALTKRQGFNVIRLYSTRSCPAGRSGREASTLQKSTDEAFLFPPRISGKAKTVAPRRPRSPARPPRPRTGRGAHS